MKAIMEKNAKQLPDFTKGSKQAIRKTKSLFKLMAEII